jgi:hypothetical protein
MTSSRRKVYDMQITDKRVKRRSSSSNQDNNYMHIITAGAKTNSNPLEAPVQKLASEPSH